MFFWSVAFQFRWFSSDPQAAFRVVGIKFESANYQNHLLRNHTFLVASVYRARFTVLEWGRAEPTGAPCIPTLNPVVVVEHRPGVGFAHYNYGSRPEAGALDGLKTCWGPCSIHGRVRSPLLPLSNRIATAPDWDSRSITLSIWNDNKVTAMTDIHGIDVDIEGLFVDKLYEHEHAVRELERKLAAIQEELAEERKAVDHWTFAYKDYMLSLGLSPRELTTNPVLEPEYAHMGPTELVQYWSDKHDGEIVVKDLAKVAVDARMFPNYRHASSSIYGVVKRKGFDKVGPGHFIKTKPGNGLNGHSGNAGFPSSPYTLPMNAGGEGESRETE